MGRAPCCEKVGLKRGRWAREEDEILANYIKEHGEGSWRSLPKNAGLLRCGKSCRLRWINYLREDVKRGNISEVEEEMIIKLHATLGNRWSLIAGHLPGRTDNEIKNYWNSHLSRRPHDFRKGGDGVVVNVDLSKLPGGGKRRGGRYPAGAKGKGKGKGKEKKTVKKAKLAEVQHHQKEEEAMSSPDISAPSSCQPCTDQQTEEQAQVSDSGVTSDGFEEGPLGLSEEMVSALLGPANPKQEMGPDVSCNEGDSGPGPDESVGPEELRDKNMEWDHKGEAGPGGPAEAVGQKELDDKAMEWADDGYCNESGPCGPCEAVGQKGLGDKAMDWDLAGLDLDDGLANDDMWGSLMWDYDEMLVPQPEGVQQQEEVMFDMLFFDNM